MPTCIEKSKTYCHHALVTLVAFPLMFLGATATAQQNAPSVAGRASASVIEPLSITPKSDLTFSVAPASDQPVNASEDGLFEIRSPGAYDFTLTIQPGVLATSPSSDSGIVVDRIEAHGSNRLEGSELFGPDGISTVRFSGRLRAPAGATEANYTGEIMVNLAYH